MLVNADGSSTHAITGPLSFASTPVWDMTGELLAYTADLDGNGSLEVLVAHRFWVHIFPLGLQRRS